jgi:N-terminal domain of toast_rack, DUF2154
MKRIIAPAGMLAILIVAGCGADAGPTLTADQEIDAGKAETVNVEILMGGGELHVEGGGTKLMNGSFRYSERRGKPEMRYQVMGSRGMLTVQSPNKTSTIRNSVNEWKLRMGSSVPLDIHATLGGGEAHLDVSKLPLRSMEVSTGAGEMDLNLAGSYANDVKVNVTTGAGEARIRLPGDMGAVVNASVGIGGINVSGLTKRDGSYYNAAYAEGKPAVRLEIHGGVGEITLSVD